MRWSRYYQYETDHDSDPSIAYVPLFGESLLFLQEC